MRPTAIENRLIEAMANWEIIDCHEHLPPESVRTGQAVDVFTLFSHYLRGDLLRAGMSEAAYQRLFERDLPLETRWGTFAPYWERVRWTSYARPALLAAEQFYGAADINEGTYRDISARMQEKNRPGLYEEVLRKTCRIRTALTQCGRTDVGTPLLTPLMPLVYAMETWENLVHPSFDSNASVRTLDDYLDACRRYVLRVKSEGAVGLKMVVNLFDEPDRRAALEVFEQLKNGALKRLGPETSWPNFPPSNPLKDYVVNEIIRYSGEQGLVVAVHTGYWGDFRKLDPLHLIPVLMRHPAVRFDVYHLGYPWVRETLMLGKGFSNVWLNLCWTHIVSQEFACAGLDEAMDLLPSNKILAFGGDYSLPVEKVFGHLVMAREDLARVLGRRIEGGQMSDEQALALARQWLWDNPRDLYALKL